MRKLKKQADSKAAKNVASKKVELGIVDCCKSFFGNYKAYLTKYIELKKPPYWLMVLWIYGISRVLQKINSSISAGTSDYAIQHWLSLWIAALIGGIVIGFIGYWLVGSIFHVGVLLAGGKKKAKTSRMIFLYAGLPFSLTVIILMLINMIAFRGDYFAYGGLEQSWNTLAILASLYSLILGYIGVREIQKTKKVRSILLFIALPIVLHTSIYYYSHLQSQKAVYQLLESIEEVQELPDSTLAE